MRVDLKRQQQIDALITAQAVEWYVHLATGDLSRSEKRRYWAWLKESPRHVAAMIEIQTINGAIKGMKMPRLPTNKPMSGKPSNIVDFVTREAIGSPRLSAQPKERRPRISRAAIAAVVAGVVFTLALGLMAKVIFIDRTFVTGPGEWVHPTLADGSVMHIGPNSKVRIAFGDRGRSISLDRGEAMFEVSKDPARPFVVTTGLAAVMAVGTEFGVALVNGAVVVTVSEGQVAVTEGEAYVRTAGKQQQSAVPLTAGEQVTLSRGGIQPVKKVDAVRELRWANGQFEVRGETIGQVAEEFNRRNRTQIVIDDPSIAVRPMSMFRLELGEPETFAQFVDQLPQVVMVKESADVIHLRGDASASASP